MKFYGTLALLLATFIGFASPSSADQPSKLFGVMDDNPVMAAAAQVGFNVVKRTVWITPSNNRWDNPTNDKRIVPIPAKYRNSIVSDLADAKAANEQVILELFPVMPWGPPQGPGQMRNTCDLANDITAKLYGQGYQGVLIGWEIGVEPNNHYFNKLQFYPDGTQASAGIYERWLSTCYDSIKREHPELLVVGGSLASTGEDDPHKPTSNTSPTLFLQKFCEAMAASGRKTPNMDLLDMHSYPSPTDQDPSVNHPWPSTTITIADYQKLNQVLGCFPGVVGVPKPDYIWGESGYNTSIPSSQPGYRGHKPDSVRLVDETTQGRYIATEIKMAYCQPHSAGFINLHLVDDPDLTSDWQSGIAYAQARRSTSVALASYNYKQSASPVRKELSAARAGTIDCSSPGLP